MNAPPAEAPSAPVNNDESALNPAADDQSASENGATNHDNPAAWQPSINHWQTDVCPPAFSSADIAGPLGGENGAEQSSAARTVLESRDLVSHIAQYLILPSHLSVGADEPCGDAKDLRLVSKEMKAGVEKAISIQENRENEKIQSKNVFQRMPSALLPNMLEFLVGDQRHTFKHMERPGLEGIWPLNCASKMMNKDVKEALSQRFRTEQPNASKRNGLFWAAQTGNHQLVKSLLMFRQLNPNAIDKDGQTPLFYAIDPLFIRTPPSNKLETARALIDKGAKVNVKNELSQTPLKVACRMGCVEIARLLLNCSADVEARDLSSETTLIVACRERHRDIAELLIENRANVNARDYCGLTPLILACIHEDRDLANLLVENGANIDVRDGFGRYARKWARDNGIQLSRTNASSIP